MRAALVTDQPLLAAGLNAVFEKAGALELVAVYSNAAELLNLLPAVSPELAIIDIGPDISFQSLADVVSVAPHCKLILLARTATAEMTYHAREVGASALLPTSLSTDRSALLSGSGSTRAKASLIPPCTEIRVPARAVRLTRRESQLVELVSRGLKNKEIATCLGIAEGTVKVYFSKLFQKVGANDRLELALFGLKNMMSHPEAIPAGNVREISPARPRPLARRPQTLYLRAPDPLRVALR